MGKKNANEIFKKFPKKDKGEEARKVNVAQGHTNQKCRIKEERRTKLAQDPH